MGGQDDYYQVSISGCHSMKEAGKIAVSSLPCVPASASRGVDACLATRNEWQQEEAFLQASWPILSKPFRPLPVQAANPTTNKHISKIYFMAGDYGFKINRCCRISRLTFVNYSINGGGGTKLHLFRIIL